MESHVEGAAESPFIIKLRRIIHCCQGWPVNLVGSQGEPAKVIST